MISNINHEKVGIFHYAFGHELNNKPRIDFLDNDQKKDFRLKLINEELLELKSALKYYNKEKILDGIGDILYVVYGTGHVFGIDFTYSNQKIQNLQNDESEKISNLIFQFDYLLEMLTESFKNKDLRNITKFLNFMVIILHQMALFLKFNLDRVFSVIHESNMTKLCSSEEEAKDTINNYKTKPQFENVIVGYRKSPLENKWVVYNVEGGKILKSLNFKEPDFSSFL